MPVEGGSAEGRTGGRIKLFTRNAERGTRNALQSLLTVLRRVTGMPDYEAYVEHLREHHPGCPIPTEREFFTQYTEAKYGAGTSRCC